MPSVLIDRPGSTSLPAYLAVPPTGAGPWPGVVVIQEVFGLNDDIREHADRLAAAGYLAVAPDLYAPRRAARCLLATFRALMAGAGDPFDRIELARQWVLGRDDCSGRVGVIGFCLGGGFALLTAGRGFDAASVNYGMVPADVAAVLTGACPVVASYGARDRSMGDGPARLGTALAANGVPHDVVVYPQAGHGFLSRHNTGPLAPLLRVSGLGYDHHSAEDAWRRILAFFALHLRAAAPG